MPESLETDNATPTVTAAEAPAPGAPAAEPAAAATGTESAPGAAPGGQTPAAGDGTNTSTGKDANPPEGTGGERDQGWGNIGIMVVAMVLIFYFMLIKPQRKREKAQRDMLANLKTGDRVVTVSGIVGEVVKVSAEDVIMRIDPNKDVRMRVRRAAVAGPAGNAETEGAVATESNKGN